MRPPSSAVQARSESRTKTRWTMPPHTWWKRGGGIGGEALVMKRFRRSLEKRASKSLQAASDRRIAPTPNGVNSSSHDCSAQSQREVDRCSRAELARGPDAAAVRFH